MIVIAHNQKKYNKVIIKSNSIGAIIKTAFQLSLAFMNLNDILAKYMDRNDYLNTLDHTTS